MSWNYHFHPFTADDYNVSFATPRNVGPPLDDKPSNPKDIGATCVAWSAIDRAERRLELLIFWRGAPTEPGSSWPTSRPASGPSARRTPWPSPLTRWSRSPATSSRPASYGSLPRLRQARAGPPRRRPLRPLLDGCTDRAPGLLRHPSRPAPSSSTAGTATATEATTGAAQGPTEAPGPPALALVLTRPAVLPFWPRGYTKDPETAQADRPGPSRAEAGGPPQAEAAEPRP